MMPWKWNIAAVTPKAIGGFKKPSSGEALVRMMPFFFNNLDGVANAYQVEKIAGAIVDAVRKGEEKFDQAFGGYIPQSNEFGIVPLRPLVVGLADNRWIWTSGASISLFWSAEDSFINTTLADDELVLVYGYFNYEPTPNTLELWFQPGANKFPIWNLEALRSTAKNYFLLPEPIIVEPRSTITIKASCRAISITEEMGLLGFFFAPNAKLIDTKW